jgi:hypothetical protein
VTDCSPPDDLILSPKIVLSKAGPLNFKEQGKIFQTKPNIIFKDGSSSSNLEIAVLVSHLPGPLMKRTKWERNRTGNANTTEYGVYH